MSTVYEVLQNVKYNLENNGAIGTMVALQQFNNALDAIEDGKELHDEMDDE